MITMSFKLSSQNNQIPCVKKNNAPYLDLNVVGLGELFALVEPRDLGLGVAGKHGLEPGPLALLVPHLLDLADKLGRLFGG